jgi:hypothetical protein
MSQKDGRREGQGGGMNKVEAISSINSLMIRSIEDLQINQTVRGEVRK